MARPGGAEAAGWYRVRVCMAQCFGDERARALVCVRAGRRVAWLLRRLRAHFALPPRVLLLSAGHLLPPAEPLAVLRPDDTVLVVPARADDWNVLRPEIAGALESGVEDSDGVTLNSGVATPNTDGDVVDAGDISASGRSASPASLVSAEADEDELASRKRDALLMLQQYCSQQRQSCGEQQHHADRHSARVARPRRRRVRRRRRLGAASGDAISGEAVPGDTSLVPQKQGHAILSEVASVPLVNVTRNTSVLRNGCERPRQPRVIRPLGDHYS